MPGRRHRALFPLPIPAVLWLIASADTIAFAQGAPRLECSARAMSDARSDGVYFLVQGEIGLPDNAVIGIGLSFAGETVPEAWRKLDVAGTRFHAELGPVRTSVLSGTYRLVVKYSPVHQYARMRKFLSALTSEQEWEFPFYAGSPEREEVEEREYRRFLQESVQQVRDLYRSLEDHRLAFSGKRPKQATFDRDEFERWRDQWLADLRTTRQSAEAYGVARVFAPLHPESLRDLSVAISFLDMIYAENVEEICRAQELPVTEGLPAGTWLPFTRMAPEYVQEAARRTEAILADLHAEPGVDSYALYRDLAELEALYRELLLTAGALRSGGAAEPWGPWHMRWAARLGRLSSAFPRYASSPLLETNPSLQKDLEALGARIRDFAVSAGASLAAAGRPEDGAPARTIEKELTRLFEIIFAERRVLARSIDAFVAGAKTLDEEIATQGRAVAEKRETPEAWNIWVAEAKNRAQALKNTAGAFGTNATFRFHFPEAERCATAAAQAQLELLRERSEHIAGARTATYEERIRYFGETSRRMIDRLAEMVKAVPEPK